MERCQLMRIGGLRNVYALAVREAPAIKQARIGALLWLVAHLVLLGRRPLLQRRPLQSCKTLRTSIQIFSTL